MSDFFASRIDIYDNHMLTEIEELPEAYAEFARLIPASVQNLLDLGCGTGLELTEIFNRLPDVSVTGIDMTQTMLDKLREKFTDKDITLVCANYLDYDFGGVKYDVAVSFETMHHLTRGEKQDIYAKIYKALKSGGKYIECDYIATQDEEYRRFEENQRLRIEQGVSNEELYHYDTPLTIENQIKLFLQAGFATAKSLWRKNSTAIIACEKK
jgi:cyclopropane fatty-acyl-phospholipid synthase-like methyltransferase